MQDAGPTGHATGHENDRRARRLVIVRCCAEKRVAALEDELGGVGIAPRTSKIQWGKKQKEVMTRGEALCATELGTSPS